MDAVLIILSIVCLFIGILMPELVIMFIIMVPVSIYALCAGVWGRLRHTERVEWPNEPLDPTLARMQTEALKKQEERDEQGSETDD